jgi:membrane protease YdiL (CAAX protease family)
LIDAHGPELADLSGLGEELVRIVAANIEYLRTRELELKRRGDWEETDPLDYVAELLRKIDRLIYSSLHFAGFKEVEVLARAPLAGSRSVVVCRSELGIYEVEQHLRALHGSRLGVIALQKSSSSYTLRQVDSFLPVNLERAYETLNLLDPAVSGARQGNRWGGSGEIGGSPRGSGTRLSPEQIAAGVQMAYRRSTPLQALLRAVQALALSTLVLGGSLLAQIDWLPTQKLASRLAAPLGSPELGYAILGATFSAALLLVFGRRYPRLYGLRAPAGSDWWLLLPLAILGALAGGVWAPGSLASAAAFSGRRVLFSLLIVLTGPLAAELLFRGLVHGLLAQSFRIQTEGSRWFLSRPVFLSALYYSIGTGAIALGLAAGRPPSWPFALLLAGAFTFGTATGMARERSGSLIPSILFHWIGAASAIALLSALAG